MNPPMSGFVTVQLLPVVSLAHGWKEPDRFANPRCSRSCSSSILRRVPFPPHPWVVALPPQEHIITNPPSAFYREFTAGEMMDYNILAHGVDKWDFDIFEFARTAPRPLACMAMVLLNRMGLVVSHGKANPRRGSVMVNWETACKFFQMVEDGYYKDIAYHTAIHAADTVHGVHYFITRCSRRLSPGSGVRLYLLVTSSELIAVVHCPEKEKARAVWT